jgi:hypothetical protein
MTHLMWLVTAASIVGTVANVYRRRWCFAVWLVTNVLWCVYDVAIGAYPQAALMAGFSSDTQLRRAWHQFGRGGTPSHSARQP